MNEINWANAPSWAKYFAVDKTSGIGYWYEVRPTKTYDLWLMVDGTQVLRSEGNLIENWDVLYERPDVVTQYPNSVKLTIYVPIPKHFLDKGIPCWSAVDENGAIYFYSQQPTTTDGEGWKPPINTLTTPVEEILNWEDTLVFYQGNTEVQKKIKEVQDLKSQVEKLEQQIRELTK